MSGEKTWFIKIDDSVMGPLRIDDMLKMVETGELCGDDLVKQSDFGAYSRVDTFEMFMAELAKKRAHAPNEELSIFIDQNSDNQNTQTTMVRESAEVRAEVIEAGKLLQKAEKKYLGKGLSKLVWLLISAFVVIVLLVVYFYLHGGQ